MLKYVLTTDLKRDIRKQRINKRVNFRGEKMIEKIQKELKRGEASWAKTALRFLEASKTDRGHGVAVFSGVVSSRTEEEETSVAEKSC